MEYLHTKSLRNVYIKHNGDVKHGLEHIEYNWDDPEITQAFHSAREKGTGVFRNKTGRKYELKHLIGDNFALEYRT